MGYSFCPRTGKRRHRTLAAAKKHLHALAGKGQPGVEALLVYQCRFCEWFHVGHTVHAEAERV